MTQMSPSTTTVQQIGRRTLSRSLMAVVLVFLVVAALTFSNAATAARGAVCDVDGTTDCAVAIFRYGNAP